MRISDWSSDVCSSDLRICYGDQVNKDAAAMPDLSKREMWLLAPIAAVVLWMGVYPESFLAPMRQDVVAIAARIEPAKPAGDAHLKMGQAKAAEPLVHHGAEGEAH